MHRQLNTKDTPTTSAAYSLPTANKLLKLPTPTPHPQKPQHTTQQHKSTAASTYPHTFLPSRSFTENSPKLTSLPTLTRWQPNEFGRSQEMVCRTVGDMGVRSRSHRNACHENKKLCLWAVDHYARIFGNHQKEHQSTTSKHQSAAKPYIKPLGLKNPNEYRLWSPEGTKITSKEAQRAE